MTRAIETQTVVTTERARLEQMTLAMIEERGLRLDPGQKHRNKRTIGSLEALMASWEPPANGTQHSEAEVMASTAEIGWVLDIIAGASDALAACPYMSMSSMRAILIWSWIHRNTEETPEPKRVIAALTSMTKALNSQEARAFFAKLLGKHYSGDAVHHSRFVIQSAWKLIDAINSTAPKKSPVIKMPEDMIAARARGDLAHSIAKEQAWDQAPPEALGWQNLHEQVQATSHAAVPAPMPNTSSATPTVLATLQLIADQQQTIIEQNNRIAAALGV